MRLKFFGAAAGFAWAFACVAQPAGPGDLHPPMPDGRALHAGATLADAVEAAWRRSALSARAAGQARNAQARHVAASATWPTPPALEVGYSRLRERGVGGHETEFGVAMPLWLPGQRTASLAVAAAQADAASAAAAAGRHAVAGSVRAALWEVELQRAETAAARAQADELDALAADVARRVAAGDLPRADSLATEAQRLDAAARLRRALAATDSAILRWTALTGLATLPAVAVQTQSTDATAVPEGHPELRLARGSVALAREHVRLVRASPREAPELVASVRREAPGAGEPATNAVGLAIRVPFSGPQRNEPLLAAALAELELAEATLHRTQQQLQAELAIARTEFDAVLRQLESASARTKLLRERAQLLRKSYEAGETPLPELLRALGAAADAHASSLRQQAALGQAGARLERALGVTP